MHGQGYLELFLIFLLAAVVAVPLFRRFGLGAVLGYLFAGVVMGPFGLHLVKDTESMLAFSELGVVMLLFVIGLELSPQRLWVMRRRVFGIGGLQVAISALAIGAAMAWLGLGWKPSLVIGLGLALSSTAVGLQILAERKELTTGYGRLAFAILLFQDLAAIPLLALIPLLGNTTTSAPPIDAVAKAVGMIVLVVVGGRLLLRQLFRAVAWTKMGEVFTATSLLVVVGTAWLMQYGGLSMGLGAFLAGVLLADSEFRHELEAQIEPFKGLLLGLFFIAVGMSIDLHRVVAEPGLIASGVAALLLLKSLVLAGIGWRPGRLPWRETLMLGTVLALGGEFAFVVFGDAFRHGLIDAVLRDRVVDAWVRSEVLRLTGARAAASRRTGTPGPEGSIGKLAMAELEQRVRELHLDLLGPAGMLYTTYEMTRPERSVSDSPHRSFLRSRATTIEGGTSEVMRNILGERVLGLPPEPRRDRDLPWVDVPRS